MTSPEKSYLSSRYYDPHRQFESWRVFYEDGRVKAYDGKEWWEVCQFNEEQVARAKKAIKESGLLIASDLKQDGIFDAALVTYFWKINNSKGQVTNWIDPVIHHPVFATLDKNLDALEAEAGAEWSMQINQLSEK